MKFLFKAAAVACLLAGAVPADAQVSVEANGARSQGVWGGELGVGYSVVSLGGFRLTPAVGAFIYKGDNDRYYMDNNGGNPRCRDSSNGQYAKTNLCDNTAAKAYGRLEATYTVPNSVTLGAGARYMSSEFRPYGTVAIPVGPMLNIKGNVGQDYYAAGILARF